MNRKRAFIRGCLIVGAALFSLAGRAEISADVDALLKLMAERLAIGSEVAQAKWNGKAPIEDLPREQRVIADTVALAVGKGVSELLARDFAAAQIEASKTVQRALHREWTKQQAPNFETAPDLARDIRPRLDKLTPVLMDALAIAAPQLANADAQELIAARPAAADPEAWKVAVAPLAARAQPGEPRLGDRQRFPQ